MHQTAYQNGARCKRFKQNLGCNPLLQAKNFLDYYQGFNNVSNFLSIQINLGSLF